MNKDQKNIKADLHIHSIYSDGIYTPRQLINKAIQNDISILSITDHDNIFEFEDASLYSRSFGIDLVPGIELSSELRGQEVHILGYFFDPKNSVLNMHLDYMKQMRWERANKIIEKLNDLNIYLNTEDLISVTDKNSAVGRPHIAVAMMNKGFINNFYEAFNKYIGENKPAYVEKPNFDIHEAIHIINNAGGLSFLAHPGKLYKDDMLVELAKSGFDGIEVIHPSHSDNEIRKLRAIAEQYFLLESGGSDFHGNRNNDDYNFGRYCINNKKFQEIKSIHQINYG